MNKLTEGATKYDALSLKVTASLAIATCVTAVLIPVIGPEAAASATKVASEGIEKLINYAIPVTPRRK